ncbi:tetratricopeptide repeat protein [Aestuariivirga sp.]|uniref:tetratricopeptide repeat protein n=1 Tax=Aestuariivirga sp. TaxID=2650926 RepID=UPI003BAB75C2
MRRALGVIAMLLAFATPVSAGALSDAYYAYRHQLYGQAVAILRPLAEQGDPYAQFNLGALYDDGLGVPRNFTLALLWYRKAGSQGLADAQYMAGRFYGNGRGRKQDPAAALFWFELASAGGHPLAPALRDQHWNQLGRTAREQVANEAVKWQSEHPHQFTCKWQKCIYPRWTARPGWTILNRDDFLPSGSP